MYKLIIVDDKANVIEGIRRFGEWAGRGVRVVGAASNGQEALRLVEETQPDIAITDISMPLMDGLAFTAQALKLNPRLKIIVLSGYDQFDYAQQAVRLGVMDYLLKPVKIDQIVAAVERACERLRTEQQAQTELQHLRDQQEQANRRQRLITLIERPQDWPTSSLTLDASDQTMPDLALTERNFAALVCQPAELVNAVGELGFVINKYGLLLAEETAARPLAERLVSLNSQARVAISQVYCGLHTVGLAYQEALNLLRNSSFNGTQQAGPIIQAMPFVLDSTRLAQPGRTGRELVVALKAGAEAQVVRLVEEFFTTLSTGSGEPGYVRAASLELLAVAAHSLNEVGVSVAPPATYAARLEGCEQLTALRTLVTEVLIGYARQVEAQRRDKNKSAVEIASEFIRANLHRNISLDDVAAHLHFTPGYLAHLFKKAQDETVVEYISRLKMERAAELVCNPDAKIASIAQSLGYGDRRYFSELFRRHYGCTPSEYKEKFLAGVK